MQERVELAAPAPPVGRAGSGASRPSRRAALALVLLVVATIGPFAADTTAQASSRSALTAAIVERGSIDITGYPVGVDYSVYGGRRRSDKAPGQPLAAVPFYALWRLAGGHSYAGATFRGALVVWWLTLWTSVVPFALLVALMWRTVASSVGSRPAAAATAAISGGTLLLVFGPQLYGHSLAALSAFGAYLCLRRGPAPPKRLFAGGALAGAAVLVEYPNVIVVAVLAVLVWRDARGRGLAWYALGGAPFAAVLGAYHTVAFGAPWRLPYAYFAKELARGGAPEGGLSALSPFNLARALAGWHGLFTVTPVVALALGGAVIAWRDPDPLRRRDMRVGVAVTAAFVLLAGSWSGTAALEVPGPRYVVPALAFLAAPLAAAWRRWPRACRLTAQVGAATMVLGVLTPHLVAIDVLPLRQYVGNVEAGRWTPTVWTILFGPVAGIAVQAATVGAAALWLRRSVGERRTHVRAG